MGKQMLKNCVFWPSAAESGFCQDLTDPCLVLISLSSSCKRQCVLVHVAEGEILFPGTCFFASWFPLPVRNISWPQWKIKFPLNSPSVPSVVNKFVCEHHITETLNFHQCFLQKKLRCFLKHLSLFATAMLNNSVDFYITWLHTGRHESSF